MMKTIVVEPPVELVPVAVVEAPEIIVDPEAFYHVGYEQLLSNQIFSDDSGLSNLQKWEHAKGVLGDAPSLFTDLSYEEVFEEDDPIKAQAAGFVADLRAQHFQVKLNSDRTNMTLHRLYVKHATWRTRFYERTNLQNLADMMCHATRLI
jgi:hypothetical protein